MQNVAQPCTLTASGTPVELPKEVVHRMQSNVDLYDGSTKNDTHRRGTLTVSSHRIIWRGETAAIQWLLSQVCHHSNFGTRLLLFI